MAKKSVVWAAILILTGCGSDARPSVLLSWKEFAAPADGFAVDAPTPPRVEKRGNVAWYWMETGDEKPPLTKKGPVFKVLVEPLGSGGSTAEGLERRAKRAADGYPLGKTASVKESTIGGQPGRIAAIRFDNDRGWAFEGVCAAADKMYVLQGYGWHDQPSADRDFGRFLGSFKLTK
jgi:hypothetical protein